MVNSLKAPGTFGAFFLHRASIGLVKQVQASLSHPGFKMKLPRRRFLHLAAGAAALPAVTHTAWAQSYLGGRCASSSAFPGGSAAMSPFSQQLMYRGREHEPLPLLLSFSQGDSEMRGQRV